MIFRAFPLIFSLLLLSCSHKSSDQKLTRSPASINFSNVKNFNVKNWLKDLSNTDVYKNREAGTQYGRAAAGKIVEALQMINMIPGASKKSFFQSFKIDSLNSKVSTRNIIALSHPQSEKQPQIIISAHYNRVNFCKSLDKNSNCFVKSDNTKGTIAALKIAALLRRHSPDTSFAIALWGAEELNNAGSHYFLKSPSFSFDQTKLHINLDLNGEEQVFMSSLSTKRNKYKNNFNNALGLSNFNNALKVTSQVNRENHKKFHEAGHQIMTVYISNHSGFNVKPLELLKVRSQHKKVTKVASEIVGFINIFENKTSRLVRDIASVESHQVTD